MKATAEILKTIQSLRARAADAASSESEAIASAEHADRLMQKHGITVAALTAAASAGGIVERTWTRDTRSMHPVQFTATAISAFTDTKVWSGYGPTRRGSDSHLHFLGFEADVECALYLTDVFHGAMEYEWAAYRKTTEYQDFDRRRRMALRDDFLRGMSYRLRERLMDMVAARSTTRTNTGAGTEIVLAKRSLITKAQADMKLNLRAPQQRAVKVYKHAFNAGKDAGTRTQIARGVRSNGSPQMIT